MLVRADRPQSRFAQFLAQPAVAQQLASNIDQYASAGQSLGSMTRLFSDIDLPVYFRQFAETMVDAAMKDQGVAYLQVSCFVALEELFTNEGQLKPCILEQLQAHESSLFNSAQYQQDIAYQQNVHKLLLDAVIMMPYEANLQHVAEAESGAIAEEEAKIQADVEAGRRRKPNGPTMGEYLHRLPGHRMSTAANEFNFLESYGDINADTIAAFRADVEQTVNAPGFNVPALRDEVTYRTQLTEIKAQIDAAARDNTTTAAQNVVREVEHARANNSQPVATLAQTLRLTNQAFRDRSVANAQALTDHAAQSYPSHRGKKILGAVAMFVGLTFMAIGAVSAVFTAATSSPLSLGLFKLGASLAVTGLGLCTAGAVTHRVSNNRASLFNSVNQFAGTIKPQQARVERSDSRVRLLEEDVDGSDDGLLELGVANLGSVNRG